MVEKMSSTSIFPELNKGVNQNEKPEVQNDEEEQATVLEQPKFDKIEKYQASVPYKKHKNDKDGASITPTKNNIDTVDKEGKSRKNLVKEANTSPISANNNIYTVDKIDKSQKFKETVHTLENNKTYTLVTMVESRSTPRTNLSNKSFHLEKTLKFKY